MASCEAEVVKIGSKLDKILGGSKPEEDALDLLDVLGRLPITLDVLTKTQIGRKLNDFRKKVTNEKLSKKAKGLIKDWKGLLNESSTDGKAEKSEKSDSSEKMPRNDSMSNISQKSSDSASGSQKFAPPAPPMSSTSNGFPPKHLINDDVRLKSAQMILSALKMGELPDGTHDPEDVAVQIEEALYKVHKGTTDKYKSSLRSRVFNLRDKKNPALRENILTGVVKPEKFAVMKSEEMASDEIKQMREKYTKESILEHQMTMQQGTPSDMFKCGKCGKKNCTYTQLQTRSSDEPMTTFVYCLECGNRWKFC